jgi:hypothetical protein
VICLSFRGTNEGAESAFVQLCPGVHLYITVILTLY